MATPDTGREALIEGRLEVVTKQLLRAPLNGDHASGASSLLVDVGRAAFAKAGGQVMVNDALYAYTDYTEAEDGLTGTLTLSSVLSAAADDGIWVNVWDPSYETIASNLIGEVRLPGAIDNDEPVHATFAQHLVDKIGEDIRGLPGEQCLMDRDHDEWRIVDILGLGDPNATGLKFFQDQATVTATGDQTLNLTFEPIVNSEHGYWNGVYQPGSEWSRVGQVVTFPDSGSLCEVGDILAMEYAYRQGIYTPPIAGVPYATEVLADAPLAYYRLGESGDYASGPGGDNDFGGSSIALQSISGATSNVGYTMQTGEPFPTGVFSNRSAWWSITSSVDQDIRLDTQLSSRTGGGFVDTEMAVWTGGTVNSLTSVASDGDSGGNNTSLLTFAATAGVTYHVQVCAYNDQELTYVLRVTPNRMADSSGNTRHGNYTAQGVSYLTRGVNGLLSDDTNKAAQFVASQGCRGFVPYASWMVQTAFTVEAVIESTQSDGVIASRGVSGSQSWLLNLSAGKLRFTRFGSGGNSQATSAVSFNDGQRHHVAATYDATNGTTLYVDGNIVATAAPATTPVTTSEPLTLASDNTTPWGGTFYEGILDEFALYGSVLSADRIGAHYDAMIGG